MNNNLRGIKIVYINGQKFNRKHVEAGYGYVKKGNFSLSPSYGLKLQSILQPFSGSTLITSNVENIQHKNDQRYANADVNGIWMGYNFGDKSELYFTKKTPEIVLALLRLFKEYMPIPTANIMAHPCWRKSVFSEMLQTDAFFIDATSRFNLKFQNMPITEYLEFLSDIETPSALLLRSDVITIQYLDIDGSFSLLVKWLKYQYGKEWLQHVQMIYEWFVPKNFKRGGCEVVGQPNAGKTYMYGALMDLFMFQGYVRPNSGYTFNFDDCVSKQVIVCDEFCVDSHTKDCLSGSPATVKIKGQKPAVLKPMLWLFMSNERHFPLDDTHDNPWNSRLYRAIISHSSLHACSFGPQLRHFIWFDQFEFSRVTLKLNDVGVFLVS